MKTDVTSMFFNSSIEGKTATPAWGTSVGQSKSRMCRIDDFKPEVVNILIGMVYKSVSDLTKLDISKGSNKREIILCSVFNDIYINNIKINDSQFVLLLVREHSDSHNGRLIFSYAPYITYNGIANQVCIDKMREALHCKAQGCWFVYDISIKDQSQLHFKAIVVDAENPKIYNKSTTSQYRSSEWNSMIPKDSNEEIQETSSNEEEEEEKGLQQIFYGAPGTGKSFKIKEITQNEDVIRTTFHPDTDYSTFVGAYKPTTIEEEIMTVIGTKAVPVENPDGSIRKESKIVYEFVPQAFLLAYTKAWKKYAEATGDEPKKQFLVIEEINRGNCAQIFGDLFQLLDRNDKGFSDYPITADADMKRQLQKAFKDISLVNSDAINALYEGRDVCQEVLNGNILLLPNNLYIWATMNTSDQSLFPIDSAFKRRWEWTYHPISDAKKGWKVIVNDNQYDWWTFLMKINDKIGSTTNSEDKKLGYFFCKANNYQTISAETFVGKVIFYLWNDVFKDYEFGDSIFDDGMGGKLTFDKFYKIIEQKTEINKENIDLFMRNLGVEPIESEDPGEEEYNGQDETEVNSEADENKLKPIEKKRYVFWEAFLNYAQQNADFTRYFNGIKKASRNHWKNFFIPGMDFHLAILQQRKAEVAEIQVYFKETNDTYYRLLRHKSEIEHEMDVKYDWKELPDRKASYISEKKYNVNFDNQDEWKNIFDFYINRLLRMREVFTKYAKN